MATPTSPISIAQTVDIGHGRGRLAPNPARSVWRIDAQLRAAGLADYADVNDAWRSPEQADANRAAWLAWQNGTGPKAPYALDRWGSIHCRGYAKDSDDWYHAAKAAILRRNGWRQTALYPVGDSRREPWHGEYDEALDEFLGQPAGNGSVDFPMEDDDMFDKDDRATLISIQLAVGAGGLEPGGIKDEDTISARLRRVEAQLKSVLDGSGTNGADAATLPERETILGAVREIRSLVGELRAELDAHADEPTTSPGAPAPKA